MVGIVDRCEHGGARDRCSMFALTLRRNSKRDQVELNARDTFACTGTPSLCEVRAEGWSELSPRCVGAAARRAGLSPSFCDAPISRRPVCFLMHTFPPLDQRSSEGFSQVPADGFFRERIRGHRGLSFLRSFFSRH